MSYRFDTPTSPKNYSPRSPRMDSDEALQLRINRLKRMRQELAEYEDRANESVNDMYSTLMQGWRSPKRLDEETENVRKDFKNRMVEQRLEREREMKSRAQQLNLMRAKSVGKDCKLISPTTQAVRQRLKEESERNMLIQQQMLQQSHMEWLQRKKQIRGKDQKRLDKEVEDRRRILAQVSMEEKELERRLLSKENKVLEQRRRLIEMFDP